MANGNHRCEKTTTKQVKVVIR